VPQLAGDPVFELRQKARFCFCTDPWRREAFQAAAATICHEAQKKSDALKVDEAAAARMASRLAGHIRGDAQIVDDADLLRRYGPRSR